MTTTLEKKVEGRKIKLVDDIFHVQRTYGDFQLDSLEDASYDINIILKIGQSKVTRTANKTNIRNLLAQYEENIIEVYVQKIGGKK